MTRTFHGKRARTSRDEADRSRRQRILDRLDDLYARLDQSLASLQHYDGYSGDQGTFSLAYQGDIDSLQDEIAHLESRLWASRQGSILAALPPLKGDQ